MAIIKNIKELSAEELKSFQKLYVQFFKTACVRSNSKFPQELSRLNTRLMARRYVIEMMDRIENGYSTAFASFDITFTKGVVQMKPTGLIVGYATDSGMANISHLYVVPETESYPRKIVLRELYKAFALDAKENGMIRIQTSSDVSTPDRSRDLEDLKFIRRGQNGTEIKYARQI